MTGLQREVLNVLLEHPMACRKTFADRGIYHPAARILELREMGFNISTVSKCKTHPHQNRLGAYVLGEGNGL